MIVVSNPDVPGVGLVVRPPASSMPHTRLSGSFLAGAVRRTTHQRSWLVALRVTSRSILSAARLVL